MIFKKVVLFSLVFGLVASAHVNAASGVVPADVPVGKPAEESVGKPAEESVGKPAEESGDESGDKSGDKSKVTRWARFKASCFVNNRFVNTAAAHKLMVAGVAIPFAVVVVAFNVVRKDSELAAKGLVPAVFEIIGTALTSPKVSFAARPKFTAFVWVAVAGEVAVSLKGGNDYRLARKLKPASED